MDLLNDIPIPLKNITVSFGYEAYFTSSNENEWIPALQEVQEKMLLSLAESSPLMQDGDVVSTTCDEIFQTAVPDLFLSTNNTTNNTVTRRTNSVDPWELFLGFLSFPEVDFDQDNVICKATTTTGNNFKESACKPIISSFTIQMPSMNSLEQPIVASQLLNKIKNAMDLGEFETSSIPDQYYVGIRSDDNQFTLSRAPSITPPEATKPSNSALSEFGVSFIVLMGAAILAVSGIVIVLIWKARRSRHNKNGPDDDVEQPISRELTDIPEQPIDIPEQPIATQKTFIVSFDGDSFEVATERSPQFDGAISDTFYEKRHLDHGMQVLRKDDDDMSFGSSAPESDISY
jgi:hypothetical protein